MTYYKRANEDQRYDSELRRAIVIELENQYAILALAQNKLEAAYKLLSSASDIEEDDLDQSSGLMEAKMNIRQAINRFSYKIESKRTDTYIGNVAAFMSAEKAEELKVKYRGS